MMCSQVNQLVQRNSKIWGSVRQKLVPSLQIEPEACLLNNKSKKRSPKNKQAPHLDIKVVWTKKSRGSVALNQSNLPANLPSTTRIEGNQLL